MITPDYSQAPPTYDPLAVQFMTGGQMGYMPQAQYLTPSQYGAFRTLPQPNMGQMPMQRPSLWQSYMIASRGNMFGTLPDYTMSNYMMGTDQSMYLTMANRRVQDAGSAFSALKGNMGLNALLSLGLGFGNPLATAGISAMLPDFGAPFTDRIAMQRRIQDQTMSRITMGRDVSAGLGQGFSAPAAARLDDSIRREAAGDLLFKEEDYRQIMRTGIESGLFDYANSAQEYKRNLKQLRDNINVMGELLGSTDFKELMGGMKRLITMGADIQQMTDITQMERMFSRMTGMRQSHMVSAFGQQGALTFSQAGLTNYQGSLAAMSHAAGITMSQRLGLLDPAMLARYGGVSGLTQNLTRQQAGSIQRTMDFYLPALANNDFSGLSEVAPDMIAKLMSGDMSAWDLVGGGQRINNVDKMGMYGASRAKMQQELMDQLGPEGFSLFQRQLAVQYGRSMGAQGTKNAMLLGYQAMGYDKELALMQANQWSDAEFVQGKMDNISTERRRTRFSALEQQKHSNALWNRAAVGFREGINTLATPFRRMAEERARHTQRDEDRNLGILSLTTPGARSMGGLRDMTDEQLRQFTQGRNLDDMVSAYAGGAPTEEEIAYQLGSGQEYKPYSLRGISYRGGNASGYIQRGRDLRRLAESTMSGKEAWERLSGQKGFNTAALAQELSRLENAGDITEDKLLGIVSGAIAKSSNVSKEAAAAQARKFLSDTQNREALLVARSKQDKNFAADVALTYKERMGEAMGKKYDTWDEYLSGFRDDLGEVTYQKWGVFDDQEQLDLLEETMETDVRGLDIYGMQVLQTQAWKGGSKKERARLKRSFIERAKRLGLSEEEATRIFNSKDGMSHKLVQDLARGMNLDKGTLGRLVQAGRKTGRSMDNAYEATNLVGRIDENQRQRWAMMSQRQEEEARDVFREYGIDVSRLDGEQIDKLLSQKSTKDDPRLQGVLQAAKNMFAKENKVTVQGIGRQYGWGTMQDIFADTDLLTGDIAKAGQEKTLGKLDSTMESLESVLRSLVSSNESVASAIRTNAEVNRRVLQKVGPQ